MYKVMYKKVKIVSFDNYKDAKLIADDKNKQNKCTNYRVEKQ